MYYSKTKRHFSFEQLDSRIAMNGDMHPSLPIAQDQPGPVDFLLHFESRSVSIATIPVQRTVAQNFVVVPNPVKPIPRPFETGLFKSNTGMKTRAEGESVPPPIANSIAHASEQFGTESPNSSAALVRSSTSIGSTSSSSVGSSSVVSSNVPPSPHGLVIPVSAREIVPAASTATRGASAAPPVYSSTTRVGSAVGVLNPQCPLLQSQMHSERSSIAAASEQLLQPSLMMMASKSETTNSTENGMLTFSLRQKTERSIALNRSIALSSGTEYRAKNAYPNTETIASRNRLPAPKGMIEIGDALQDHSKRLQQSMVWMACNNPFEILQLFIGSTNMVSNAWQTTGRNTEPKDNTEPKESTELASKEDSILSLAIGVVFVIAARQCKILQTAEKLPSLRFTRRSENPQPDTAL